MKRRDVLKSPIVLLGLLGVPLLKKNPVPVADAAHPMIDVRSGRAVGDFSVGDMVVLNDPPQVVGICVHAQPFGSADLFLRESG